MIYGYARVSTDGQSGAAQVAELTKEGCAKVFRETASWAQTNRAQLRKALDQLEAGDVLMVTRLDRLARSTRDLLNTLAVIAERKAGFRSLGDAWADTTTPHGRLMLAVLGDLAEFERDLIRARTNEGRKRAVAQGVKMGRKPKLTPHQQREAIKRRDRGDETLREIARRRPGDDDVGVVREHAPQMGCTCAARQGLLCRHGTFAAYVTKCRHAVHGLAARYNPSFKATFRATVCPLISTAKVLPGRCCSG